jgi:hypothetical protein
VRRIAIGVLTVIGLAVLGCTTTAVYPQLTLSSHLESHAPYPGLETLDERGIKRLLRTRVRLPPRPSAALVWFEERTPALGRVGSTPAFRSRLERDPLLADLTRAIEGEPLAWIEPVPSALGSESEIRGGRELRALRSAAAHLQGDLVLLVQSQVNEKITSGSWIEALLTALEQTLSPVRRSVAYASSEVCAVDVRTGIVMACGRGNASRIRRFSFVLGLGRLRPKLARESLIDATEQAGQGLRLRLAARLEPAAPASPDSEGS